LSSNVALGVDGFRISSAVLNIDFNVRAIIEDVQTEILSIERP